MSLPKVIIFAIVLIGILGIMTVFHAHKKAVAPVTLSTSSATGIRYLPLGDSYTIGESVLEQDRWPNQLVARYNTQAKMLQIVANPSVTGFTSQDLIDRELPLVSKLKPDFVTVLIGVNDYVQSVPIQTFHKNLEYIVSTLQQQLHDPQNILLITIPDYGKTPTGARYGNPTVTEAGIKDFNSSIKQVATAHKLLVADIFPVSQAVTNDPSLIAKDGLHPSAKEYTAWTDIIFQTMQANKLPRSL